MKKITHLSRLKIRWLNTKTLIFLLFGLFLPVLNGAAQTYCTPAYFTGCSWDEDLNSFKITGQGTSVISDLNTGCTTNGYLDNSTAIPAVDLLPGQSYPVEMNTNYTAGWEKASIWIDFNNDGTFDNTTEKLLTDLSLDQHPSFSTATIDIPITATPGIRRMRVRVVYNGLGFDACSNEDYGEAHDYSVNILPLTPCTGTPTAGTASATQRTCAGDPFTLLLTGSTVGGNLTYQWQSSPQGAGTWTNLTGATTISYTVTNQTADTDYRCIVTCTTSNSNDTSTVVSVAHIAPIGNFYEDFETTVTGGYSNPTVPDCWSYFVNTGYGYGYTSTGGQTGKGFYAYPYSDTELFLVSPETVDLGNGTKQVRFSANLSSTGIIGTAMRVYSLDGKTSTAAQTLIQTIPLKTTGWQEYIVPLPVTTDDYFAIAFYGAPSQYPNIYIDDVYYEDLSPCIFPLGIDVTNVTTTTANISWDASTATGVTGYEYEVRDASGTVVQSGSTTGATSTSDSITGLTSATEYFVY